MIIKHKCLIKTHTYMAYTKDWPELYAGHEHSKVIARGAVTGGFDSMPPFSVDNNRMEHFHCAHLVLCTELCAFHSWTCLSIITALSGRCYYIPTLQMRKQAQERRQSAESDSSPSRAARGAPVLYHHVCTLHYAHPAHTHYCASVFTHVSQSF